MDILDLQAPTTLAERLESNDIAAFEPCPFALPSAEDRAFLFEQSPSGLLQREIRYDPESKKTIGFVRKTTEQAHRLGRILSDFADAATVWLRQLLPVYARAWRTDCVRFIPEEQATRKLVHGERTDLLHIEAFSAKPTQGHRILRLCVNLHPSQARVWATSQPLADVLARYGARLERAAAGQWTRTLRQGLWNFLYPNEPVPSAYDDFMARLQRFLKDNDDFQEKAVRKFRRFAPGSAWLAFTDGMCHADLRGQFLLEHSFLIAPQDLASPNQAPIHIWQRFLSETHRSAA